jgi:hypothetical protein
VLVAAYGTASPKAALADACSAGEKVATSGIKGLPAA